MHESCEAGIQPQLTNATLVLLNIRSDADWTRSIMADTGMAVVAIYGIAAASSH